MESTSFRRPESLRSRTGPDSEADQMEYYAMDGEEREEQEEREEDNDDSLSDNEFIKKYPLLEWETDLKVSLNKQYGTTDQEYEKMKIEKEIIEKLTIDEILLVASKSKTSMDKLLGRPGLKNSNQNILFANVYNDVKEKLAQEEGKEIIGKLPNQIKKIRAKYEGMNTYLRSTVTFIDKGQLIPSFKNEWDNMETKFKSSIDSDNEQILLEFERLMNAMKAILAAVVNSTSATTSAMKNKRIETLINNYVQIIKHIETHEISVNDGDRKVLDEVSKIMIEKSRSDATQSAGGQIGGWINGSLNNNNDINARIGSIQDRAENDFLNYDFNIKEGKRLKRKEIFSDKNTMHCESYKDTIIKILQKKIPSVQWNNANYKDKIAELYDILKKLNFIFQLESQFDERVWDQLLASYHRSWGRYVALYGNTENTAKEFMYNTRYVKYAITYWEKTPIAVWWPRLIGPTIPSDNEAKIYVDRIRVIYTHFADSFIRMFSAEPDLTWVLFNIPRFQKNVILFDNVCNAIKNCKSGNKCNKFLVDCILNANITLGTNIRYDPNIESVPGWQKCAEYLDNGDYWDNIITEVNKTPSIIIFAILIIFKFKIKDTTYTMGGEEVSFYEFESYNSWLTDTLENELKAEISDENVRNTTHKKIKENTKLKELFNLYLDLVPHAILNTTDTVNRLEKYRRQRDFRSSPNSRTLDSIFEKAISKQREDDDSYGFSRGHPVPMYGMPMYGGEIKTDNKYLLRALGHQLYDLNKSIKSVRHTGDHTGGGKTKTLYPEEGSNFLKGMGQLIYDKNKPLHSVKIQGLVKILDKIQPMDTNVKEKLRNYVDTIKKQEIQMLSIQLILGHIMINNNKTKHMTFNDASFDKLIEKYMKKEESNDDELVQTLKYLNDSVFPFYRTTAGDLYIRI